MSKDNGQTNENSQGRKKTNISSVTSEKQRQNPYDKYNRFRRCCYDRLLLRDKVYRTRCTLRMRLYTNLINIRALLLSNTL